METSFLMFLQIFYLQKSDTDSGEKKSKSKKDKKKKKEELW